MRTLTDNELYNIDAYFRATNYLSLGQLYLKDNPLLKEELQLSSSILLYYIILRIFHHVELK